jgi:hypothetical protein
MNPPKTFGQWMIALVIVCAVCAIVIAGAQHFGIVIPQIVWTVAGIVLVAALLILAIRFLLGIGGAE